MDVKLYLYNGCEIMQTVDNVKEMKNGELIDTFEEIGIDHIILMNEILRRYSEDILTDEDKRRIDNIQVNRACNVLDHIDASKEDIEKGVKSVIDAISNSDR